jgi:transcriptional regulator with XRE-family HTH domain
MLSVSKTMIAAMHEGQRLKAVLDAAGVTLSAFAKAAGVTPTSAGRYIQTERFSREPWGHVLRGLVNLKIDPKAIRPTATAATTEITSYVSGWTVEQLRALETILTATPEQQQRLLDFVRGALAFSRR